MLAALPQAEWQRWLPQLEVPEMKLGQVLSESGALKDEFKRPPVLHLLLRYTQALITQMTQTAVCNRHHTLDQQLSAGS